MGRPNGASLTSPWRDAARIARPVLAGVVAIVVARLLLERTMWAHMLLNIPVAVAAGAYLTRTWRLPEAVRPWNVNGVAGLLLASLTVAMWMVPRLLDAAVEDANIDALKVCSLFAAGAIVGASWRDAGLLSRVFMVGTNAWMSATIGVLLINAPTRVCVRYGAQDQIIAGYGLLMLTLAAATWALLRVGFTNTSDETTAEPLQAASESTLLLNSHLPSSPLSALQT